MKNIRPTFPRIIAHDICQATIYQGPQGILPNIVQMIRSFLWDLIGRQKQTFQKLAVFKMTKDRFSSYYRVWQTSRIIILESIGYFDIYSGTYKGFFRF